MDHPYYTVTLETADWTFQVIEGQTDQAARVQVLDGLSLNVDWDNDQVPGFLEPPVVSWQLAARTAAELPMVEVGQIVTVTIRAGGPTTQPIVRLWTRVTEVTGELRPGEKWPVRLRISATDLLADLASRFPSDGPYTYWWWSIPHLLGDLGYTLGVRFGVPTSMPASAGTESGWDEIQQNLAYTQVSAREQLEHRLNCYLANTPDGGREPLTVVSYRGPSWPPGFKAAAPSMDGAAPVPVSDLYYLAVPAGRTLRPGTPPYRLTGPASGPVDVEVRPSATTTAGRGFSILNAAWCDLPATARMSRELAPTEVVLEGTSIAPDPSAPQTFTTDDATRTVTLREQAFQRSRSLPLGRGRVQASYWAGAAPGTAAAESIAALEQIGNARMDAAAAAEMWTFDEFTVVASRIPQASARAALAGLFPDPIASATDPRIVKWALLHNIPAEASLTPRGQVRGFVAGAALTITGGDLQIKVRLAPGTPRQASTTSSITAAQLAAGPYTTTPATAFAALTAIDARLIGT